MATSTTSRTPLDSPDAPRSRGRAFVRFVIIVIALCVLLGAGTLIGLRLARAGVLPGVTVDGMAVGGLTAEQLEQRLVALAERKGAARIVAKRGNAAVGAAAANLGYAMDIEATVAQVLYRGRQGNPLTALTDQLRGFRGGIEVEPAETVDADTLNGWAEAAAEELALRPVEGGLRFEGAEVVRRDPRPGASVDAEDVAAQAQAAALAGGGATLEVATEAITPMTTVADVDAVVELGEAAVSGPVTFSRGDVTVTLSPEELGGILRTRVVDGDIVLRAYGPPLEAALGEDTIAQMEVDPESASFEISGGSIELIEGQEGFTFNVYKAAKQLVEVATGDGPREATLDGDIVQPELSTEEAQDYEIVEKVSEFTTEHSCCESRVTNIHRIADIVDDVVIEPGETFSVNGFVGERTEEKGFVGGGAIYEGEFVEQIGGGVSQFATTTYNAAYFGDYEIVEHKAHSYYISRYPMGREATLNYPNVDLKIRNNSPHGMVISTSYTDTSITVAVYGKKWVEVESITGEPRNFTEPETIYRENNDLKEGSSKVVQEAGPGGFDVTVTRVLTFPDGEVKREEVTTTYLAQSRIIERNT